MIGYYVAAAVINFISQVTFGCKVTESSGPNPYLVRMIFCAHLEPYPELDSLCNDNITVAHGSLISPDKVLTTCSWYTGEVPLGSTRLRIYNDGENCFQERQSSDAGHVLHRDCRNKRDGKLFKNDFGLWFVDTPFDVDVNALLWRGMKPPSLADVKDVVTKISNLKTRCSTAVFKNRTIVENDRQQVGIQTLPWHDECLKTLERIFPVSDYNVTTRDEKNPLERIGMYSFYCGRDDLPHGNFSAWDIINVEWYDGAAVVCEVDGKKVPIGMISRAVIPPPWVNVENFRLSVIFNYHFYDFIRDNIGIVPDNDDAPDTCPLSGISSHSHLLRIMRIQGVPKTVAHGSLIKKNMVLSSCSPFKDLPKVLTDDKSWSFWGYNTNLHCIQMRRPRTIFKHKDCMEAKKDRIIIHDFAIWVPLKDFNLEEHDMRFSYPNLWAGPMAPPYYEIDKSIYELSDDRYVDIISRHLSVGIFLDPNLFSDSLMSNGAVDFVPWPECKSILEDIDGTAVQDVRPENVGGYEAYPVFCAYDRLEPRGPASNVSQIDYYSGAIPLYTFLYLYEWGKKPEMSTYPLGVFSRVYHLSRPKELDGLLNLRIISAFGGNFSRFLAEVDRTLNPQPFSGQNPCRPAGFTILGVLISTIVRG